MVLGLVAVAFFLYKTLKYVYNCFFGKVEIDQEDYEEGWYGKGPRPVDANSGDSSIRPFKIHVPNEILTDLKERLQRARFEPPLEDAKFSYGFNSDYLQSVVDYWKSEFDWRKQEDQLNKYPHFKTCIEGIEVHFVHVKPTLPEGKELKVIPILITHGWPGSFYEFYKLIPHLTAVYENKDFIFEVVCPSIPGYGFSESPHQKGFNVRATARIFVTLMERLGHKRFYVQGGDWGSFVSQLIGKYYSDRTIGVHLNMLSTRPRAWDILKAIVVAYFPSLIPKEEYKSFYPFKEKVKFLLEESGYMHIQSTKPDTVGCAFADSPVGLAAYILEKFSTWTDRENRSSPNGNLTKKFTMDDLLTNIMIYWVNNNFTSSVRYYKENIASRDHDKMPLSIPCGVALFPNEIVGMPRCLTTQLITQLVSYTVMPRGGHFAAFEEPQLLAEDIWKFVAIVQKMN